MPRDTGMDVIGTTEKIVGTHGYSENIVASCSYASSQSVLCCCVYFDAQPHQSFSYISTSISNPDLNATIIFSSYTTILSINLLTSGSEYSVIASTCSPRNVARSSTRSFRSLFCAASMRISCRCSRIRIMTSPISSILI